ncbi:hypothetical protein F0L74_13265 [Chitinophaga agrisoli]|uniref:Uncharacterized protein n=1 Tax=Chitinophaga agrisoli TaxID=2607653 RepID=A0A5B2VZJ1_9BACT|nr:hypothetical protein [Chitinophaga agrisoli]KAA2243459.1 hypothetical protein F0L74_13265 [Chitinophaga agrisoli]
MHFIVEEILASAVKFVGASVRWLCTGCRRRFRDVLEDGFINGVVGFLMMVAAIIVGIIWSDVV